MSRIRTCQWLDDVEGAVFCGAPIARGSYCEAHAATVYRGGLPPLAFIHTDPRGMKPAPPSRPMKEGEAREMIADAVWASKPIADEPLSETLCDRDERHDPDELDFNEQ